MLVADILRNKGGQVQTTTADTLLQEAINVLAKQRIGALVVSGNGRTIEGILSERDIVRALAKEALDFSSQTVGYLMTSNVFTCTPDTSVVDVMELMDKKRIRHVPITVSGILAGVVSIGDVVNARLKEAEMERKEMADYIAGTTNH